MSSVESEVPLLSSIQLVMPGDVRVSTIMSLSGVIIMMVEVEDILLFLQSPGQSDCNKW